MKVIEVENLSKQYRLGNVGTGTLKEDFSRWWHRARGKEDPLSLVGEVNDRTKVSSSNYVWALKDINFSVQQGEVLGIIGRNGAGKSTLLKILSKTTAPTTGSIKVNGRIASLLEVGTGFHPELTGRENIYLNGAILGMRKAEITRKLDEIIAFAGVERYIDTPVKRYSSGMYVRLAFAVAAHLEPEILIIDEVLAVGDIEFQKKCLGKIDEVSRNQGRTVLFVSHNSAAITELCPKCILMQNGSIIYSGETENVLLKYGKTQKITKTINNLKFQGTIVDHYFLLSCVINSVDPFESEVLVYSNEQIRVVVKSKMHLINNPFQLCLVVFKDNIRLFTLTDTSDYSAAHGIIISEFMLESNILRPGVYRIGIGIRSLNEDWVWCDEVANFEILPRWKSDQQRLNYGVLNLTSETKRLKNDT